MDLENMKSKWESIDEDTQGITTVNSQLLQDNSQRKYSTNLLKIAIPEMLLSVLYLYLLVFFIGFNEFFDTSLEKVLSYLAILLSIVLPFLSLSNVYQFYKTGKKFSTYSETLKLLEQQCNKFNKLQYIIVGLNLVLLLCCVFLMPTVYSEQLTTTQTTITFISLGLLSLFLSHYFWKYYRKQIRHNEALLETLLKV